MRGYINKTADSIPREVIISLYLAFVRQSLEYCIQFSALRDKKGMDKLELVQWRATRTVGGRSTVSWNSWPSVRDGELSVVTVLARQVPHQPGPCPMVPSEAANAKQESTSPGRFVVIRQVQDQVEM